MKNKFLLLLLCGSLATFVSCSDDDETKLSNEFTLNGNRYALTAGSYSLNTEVIDEETIYEWNIYLDGTADGQEHYFRFFVYNLNEGSPDGTYTYQRNGWANGKFVSHFESHVAEVHDLEAGEIKSGTITVKKTGEEFDVTFDITYLIDGEEKRIEGAMKAEFEQLI